MSTTTENVLVEPRVFESIDGFLNVTVTLEESLVRIDDTLSIRTRTYNGTMPGPTLAVKPGDAINIRFVNLLKDQGIPYKHNAISAPDESNLHFHGLYVSGELPSDDATIVVEPGQTFDYSTTLPVDHHPGLHWLHPHRHASTALQVGGGAAAAIIVKDPDESEASVVVPRIYTHDARQIVMVIQPILVNKLNRLAQKSNDALLRFDGSSNGIYMLINGQHRPSVVVTPRQWIRLRIVYAAWSEDHLRLRIPDCEMQLIAKDGIYLPKIPRFIERTDVVPGGRADIMMKCNTPLSSFLILQEDLVIATIVTTTDSDDDVTEEEQQLPPWDVSQDYPEYLQDLQSAVVEPSCSCTTIVGGRDGRSRGGINGFSFEKEHTTHYYQMGQVAERTIRADRHPYHQHVYPFQIQSGFETTLSSSSNGYYQVGDWHDTIEGKKKGVVRFLPQRFDGKIMIHCHRLDHEDEGMMGIERQADSCMCGLVRDDDGEGLETWVVALISVAALALFGALTAAICIRRRRRNKRFSDGS